MHVYYLGTADGVHNVIVAAANQKEACGRLNCSVGYFRRYGGIRLDPVCEAARLALAEPGRVFRQKYDYTGRNPQPWEKES